MGVRHTATFRLSRPHLMRSLAQWLSDVVIGDGRSSRLIPLRGLSLDRLVPDLAPPGNELTTRSMAWPVSRWVRRR